MNERKTIFVVDDDDDDRMLIHEALVGIESTVDVVDVAHADALPGLLESWAVGPKLVLMDMNMPRTNGLEMLARLKRDLRYKHIPVVMISTTTNRTLIRQAYDLGANAFIVKPVLLSEYEQVACGVGLCFLNNYQWTTSSSAPTIPDERTIIIVEDSDDHWHILEMAIKNSLSNYKVVRISTKERAIAFTRSELSSFLPAVDMILIDLYLPERKDGLELLSEVRSSLNTHHMADVPILVFTYSESSDDVDACYRNQANAYLVKPLDITRWQFYFKNLLAFWSKTVKPSKLGQC